MASQRQTLSMQINRRELLRLAGAAVGGVVLGGPSMGQEAPKPTLESNLQDFLKVPRGPHALPGAFPGKVVQVLGKASMPDDKPDQKVISEMFKRGLTSLTGKNPKKSFKLLFTPQDVVGIKVNPVGAPVISTRLEVVQAIIDWLTASGLPKENIVIWDRFGTMLKDAGFTAERFPGVRIEALQVIADEGEGEWKDAEGQHLCKSAFDLEQAYVVKGIEGKSVRGYENDDLYLRQHVFNGEVSYFGKLVTQTLTKIINVPVFKNTGNGVSMATKNLGYAAICNTGRLHSPLGFKVNTEVLAHPSLREKVVLNVMDGLRGQFEGGPMLSGQHVYPHKTLYFATDPFAMDAIGHSQMVEKRKAMGIAVNSHPSFTEYLQYAEKLGLGVVDPAKVQHIQLEV